MSWDEMIKAFKEYKTAAENGDAAAQCALAHCYLNGDGVQTSMKNGKMWFEKSAAQGYADAQFYLGILYLYRRTPDAANAEIWFEKAAAQGDEDVILFDTMMKQRYWENSE